MVRANTHEALVNQRLHVVHIGFAHVLCGLERAAAGEDCEPREDSLLLWIEEVIAPLDRRSQRLLPCLDAAAGCEQVESLRETLEQLGWREYSHARRGQLERQRQIVESLAERAHLVCRHERRIDRACAGSEQPSAVLRFERGDEIDVLRRKTEHLTACDQDLEVRTCAKQFRDWFRSVQKMFEVVDEQEKGLVADVLSEARLRAEGTPCRLEDKLGVA